MEPQALRGVAAATAERTKETEKCLVGTRILQKKVNDVNESKARFFALLQVLHASLLSGCTLMEIFLPPLASAVEHVTRQIARNSFNF